VEDTGTLFGGMFRFIEISAGAQGRPRRGSRPIPGRDAREPQLAAVATFQQRIADERAAWQERIGTLVDQGARPVMWGAGSRGVQFLTFADAEKRLAAVVDVNPRKWGRYLPVTAHRVQAPELLSELKPQAVIITNPSYRKEIEEQLRELGVEAELLIA
jgi:FlaA1/EpsC-like NDP-sugar epimerase